MQNQNQNTMIEISRQPQISYLDPLGLCESALEASLQLTVSPEIHDHYLHLASLLNDLA